MHLMNLMPLSGGADLYHGSAGWICMVSTLTSNSVQDSWWVSYESGNKKVCLVCCE